MRDERWNAIEEAHHDENIETGKFNSSSPPLLALPPFPSPPDMDAHVTMPDGEVYTGEQASNEVSCMFLVSSSVFFFISLFSVRVLFISFHLRPV